MVADAAPDFYRVTHWYLIGYTVANEHGNFGDCEPVGVGVSEMRIHVGPGYRAYFTRRAEVVYLLLLGGDKSSQKRDIKRAIEMARTLNKE